MDGISFERIAAVVSELCNLPGPGGYEGRVRERLRKLWSARVSEQRVDPVGNLLARIGAIDGPRVLIEAHMDEIGFRIRYITPEGFLLVVNAQQSQRLPQERRYMIGHPVQVLTRGAVAARGIFAAPSGHTLDARMLEQGHLMIDDFFVDLGLASRQQVEELGIHVGSPVIFDVETRRLGSRLVGKALDDRLLLAVMTLLLEKIDPSELGADVWLGATIQEENGVHGALALAARERFDAVIALDVGLSGDIPVLAAGAVAPVLGGGPVVVHGDQLAHYDSDLTWRLIDAAAAASIPIQHGAFGDYGSDGLAYLNAGIPTALVATPVRYTHTPNEMAEIADVEQTVALLHSFVSQRR